MSSLNDYTRRWTIETLFQSFKGRGFILEQISLADPDRVNRLIGVLLLKLCWCYATGEWRNQKKPIRTLKHGRLQVSIF